MTVTRRKIASLPIASVKAVDGEPGSFEAIVAVFDNVDFHGERIKAGAFSNSLERWRAAGDPIPVIWTHQWHDLSAYVGTVDPANARELAPGDPLLPDAVRDLGGLYVKADLFAGDPDADKIGRLLKTRAIREFSFAFDVVEEGRADDGYNDLTEIDVIEVGPTLKGANPATQLIGAKAFDSALAEVAAQFSVDGPALVKAFRDSVAALDVAPPASVAPAAPKAFVALDGSLELLAEKVERAATEWAVDAFGGDVWAVYSEATFSDAVVFYVEMWDDPYGGGRYFEASYTVTGDDVELGEPAAVTIRAVVEKGRPTSRRGRKEGRRNAASDAVRIQDVHDLAAELGATCSADEPDGATSDDDETEDDGKARGYRSVSAIRATVAAELLDL